MSFDSDLMQIQDICEKVCSGGTPSTRNKEFYIDGTIPWIKTKEVNNCKIFSAETHITEEALAKSSAKLIPENSVIIAMYGNGDTAGRVAINKIPVATNQACCNLIVEPTKADYRFVFYYLRTQYQKLVDLKNGGAQQNLNAKLLKEYPFPNVSRAKQTDIADFLEQLDDKIALNIQTNQTLEQMAQAIFKSWFVDFDPVKAKMNGEQPEGMDAATASLFPEKLVESELGLIPEGWDVGTLSDVAKYCSARTKTDTITLENYISTENMLAEKKGVTAASKLPTAKTVAAYKSGDILVSNIRPYFKKIWLAEGSGGRSNDVLGFESVSANTESYLMNVLYQDTFFEYMTRTSKGAKMPRGDKTAIMNWEMAVPPVELREAFSAIVDKFYQLIPQNRAQNATLESLRDTLLPKLLSGELSLTDSLEVTNV
ncbi:restriction endonuclease subunit S [Vibrio parahaemolyticus]|uniref:restriction endonuclease subunit S n=1 Tax=Vibrio harveyi group TaxID=717610 RepID=UPI0009AB4B97|nr:MULTISPECIES: restriction endonuclease subunit S [Vibrio harveyi group]MDF5105392.1 restriction endonuclease subunit S [Vibrio parahaemolyticus]MDF5140298.1 restriction endonuclease subunit S [Vibrio parahaemolyticus]MDF5150717.1 restriction endonuclease subunit S [Vibrio parahaemolyticus]HAV1414647.1 restriction endonuclease subunit S [Vibrio parahaemolyticus]HAV2007111.1 restriction endonuclease subunit S [Vibrio parahaemolyticus]